jgi:hypothetical protein
VEKDAGQLLVQLNGAELLGVGLKVAHWIPSRVSSAHHWRLV